MDEKKIRVSLLGMDPQLMSSISEKINSSRPVDVTYYTDLKDFLEGCVQSPPDIVGISLSFPHKSITMFPRVLKMALNTPVITYGENQESHTRKLLSASTAEYKISGLITAHNLWMKLVSFQKKQEELLKAEESQKEKDEKKDTEKNAVFLKGEASSSEQKDKGSMLSSLFAALNENDNEESIKNKLNIIKSSPQTEYKKAGANHINSSDNPLSREETPSQTSSLLGSNGKGEDETSAGRNSLEPTSNNKSKALAGEKNKKEKSPQGARASSKKNVNIMSSENTKTSNKKDGSELQNKNRTNSNNLDNKKATDQKQNNKAEMQKSEKSSELNSNVMPLKDKENSPDLNEQNNKKKTESGQQTKENSKKEESSKYGKVKIADEKEYRAKEKEKAVAKANKENEKKNDVLQESCELALEKVFFANTLEKPRTFESQNINIFIVESGNYKGFLSLANSFSHEVEAYLLNEFSSVIAENFKKHGLEIKVSNPFLINFEVENYVDIVNSFSEFLISYEEETGKQQIVSFVKRESVRPKIEESDRDGMYLVDIKVIPPQTIVNFDAFLYLPRNKRFVRYLKEGRSLSLEQAKRHTEVLKNNSLYLPKDNKLKFVQFFIQNTINWELAVSKNKTKKSA